MGQTLAEVLTGLLHGAGLSETPWEYDSNIHGWRCEYPDTYGKCECFQELVVDLTDVVTAWLGTDAGQEAAQAARSGPGAPASSEVGSGSTGDDRGPQGPIAHVGGNAENCPGCIGRTAHLKYPFLCPEREDRP